jgi:multidrug efflux pump subunit AcrA (membrane-fusion protein)
LVELNDGVGLLHDTLVDGLDKLGRGHLYVMRRLLIPVLILNVAACAHRAAPSSPALSVQTAVATSGAIHPSEQLAGIIAPYENVAIQSTLTEPADAVNVQEGDTVYEGEVLARLDTADLQAQLDSDVANANSNHANTVHTVYQGSLSISQGYDALKAAYAAVSQADANLKRDQAQLNRDLWLFRKGYVALQQVQQDQATVRGDQSALNTAVSSVASAKSNVQANGTLNGSGLQESSVEESRAQEAVAWAQAQQVRVQIGKALVISPISGVVVNRNLNAGEYPGTRQIFTLQQVDPVYAILHGSGAQIAQIALGARAHITVSDLGNNSFNGTVVGVLNQINPGSTDFQVKVVLANPSRKLRPGMAIVGSVILPPVRGIEVPETAFTDDNHDAVMTVASDGTVATVPVTEVNSDGKTAIVTGLQAGVRVVSNGQESIGDGEKVSVQ